MNEILPGRHANGNVTRRVELASPDELTTAISAYRYAEMAGMLWELNITVESLPGSWTKTNLEINPH